MQEKGKNKTLSNNSLVNMSKTRDQDIYDSNNQLYLNTVSSTYRTAQSAQRSPKENYKSTILSERRCKIVDINKPSLVTKAMTVQERTQRGSKVTLELFRVITFENIGQDLNGNEILISKSKDITSEGKKVSLTLKPSCSLTERGGIVNLDNQVYYNKDKLSNGITFKELTSYDTMKENGVLLSQNILKQYDHFYRRYFILRLRLILEKKSNKGQCKELLRKIKTIQLRKNKSSSSIIINRTLNDGRLLVIPSKKRFIRHSFYSKCCLSSLIVSSVQLIQRRWRKRSQNRKNRDIIMSMIIKFPLLKEQIIKAKKRQASILNSKRKTDSNRSKSQTKKNIIQMNNHQGVFIEINKITPYSISKINQLGKNIIEQKARSIQKKWKATRYNKTKENISDSNVSIRSQSSLSFITKEIRLKKISLSTSISILKAFITTIADLHLKNNQANRKYFLRKIRQHNSDESKNKRRKKRQSLLLNEEFLTHNAKFTYALNKIISKSIQEKVFYLFKRNQYQRNMNSIYHSSYYRTLRKHLMLIETFPNQNQIEEESQSKLFVQLALCQYFSISSSLDFYCLYWNDKDKESQNELSLTNDVFKYSYKHHMMTYITLFIKAYYKQTIIEHPFLLDYLNRHLFTQCKHFNTSIFGISRYINDFIEAIVVQKMPFCSKCCCFSVNNEAHPKNDENHRCKVDAKSGRMQRAKSNVVFKSAKVKLYEQRIETFDDKRHVIKVSIEKTITKKKKKILENRILTNQMRFLSDVNFFNMAKETRFKLGS